MSDTTVKRVLFVAEAATLAHVIRPLVLAKSLEGTGYEVHFACAENDLTQGKEFIFRDTGFTRWKIHSEPSAKFLRATAAGTRVFDFGTLEKYADDDIRLFEQVQPDLVVGDMRWSLTSSAPAFGVPHVTIQNAYWSPHSVLQRFPLPEYDSVRLMVKWFGIGFASALSNWTRPLAFKYHLRPINQLRRKYGLKPFDELLAALNHGDYTVYADIPELVPVRRLAANQLYLGPIAWTPPVPLPAWWEDLPGDRPLVYVTLGSSGQTDVLPKILAALEKLPVTVMLATAGMLAPASYPANVFVADYLPGDKAAERSSLVIGNGGSGLIYQAIGAGVPLLGIPSNLDQLLAMAHVENSGCGIQLRSGSAGAADVIGAIEKLLGEESYRAAAQRMRQSLERWHAPSRFADFVKGLLGEAAKDPAWTGSKNP
jgi:UDP:flavonoid glycosyltransferase YjiC (YdhE family)